MRRLLALTILLIGTLAAPAAAREATEAGLGLPPPREQVFPVDGPVAYGQAEARFGGGRGHQGQDVFAPCGTTVRAARGGTVSDNRYDGAGGNYLVVQTFGGRGNVYMHLRHPARPVVGDVVLAGDPIGVVGQTGVASECHLHFELWTAPGWYRG